MLAKVTRVNNFQSPSYKHRCKANDRWLNDRVKKSKKKKSNKNSGTKLQSLGKIEGKENRKRERVKELKLKKEINEELESDSPSSLPFRNEAQG